MNIFWTYVSTNLKLVNTFIRKSNEDETYKLINEAAMSYQRAVFLKTIQNFLEVAGDLDK